MSKRIKYHKVTILIYIRWFILAHLKKNGFSCDRSGS